MDIPLLLLSSLYGLFIVVIFTVGMSLGLIRQDSRGCSWIVCTIIMVAVICLLFIVASMSM